MTTANMETNTGTLITDLLATAEKCKTCGHPQGTDEHAGISHYPFTRAHSFVPSGAVLSRPPAEDEIERDRR